MEFAEDLIAIFGQVIRGQRELILVDLLVVEAAGEVCREEGGRVRADRGQMKVQQLQYNHDVGIVLVLHSVGYLWHPSPAAHFYVDPQQGCAERLALNVTLGYRGLDRGELSLNLVFSYRQHCITALNILLIGGVLSISSAEERVEKLLLPCVN